VTRDRAEGTHLTPDEREVDVSDAGGSVAKASCSNNRRPAEIWPSRTRLRVRTGDKSQAQSLALELWQTYLGSQLATGTFGVKFIHAKGIVGCRGIGDTSFLRPN
jgi:hypothetical protein